MLADLPRFPCANNKRPLTPHGFYDARREADHSSWPLVGVRTGAASGFDVLDIDPEGAGWLAENEARLPRTRRHTTQRGVHLLFAHASGVGCRHGLVKGVDVKGEGGFVIWWPREGYAVDEVGVAQWPEWLLELVLGPRRTREGYLSTSLCPHDGVVVGLTEALRKLDPRRWNGKYEEWLSLMMACKFAGIEREAFIEWSIGDPDYADDGEVIARKWESFAPKHAGALFAALKEAGIKVAKDHTHHHGPGEKSAEVPLGAPTHDLQRRTRSLLAWLARAPSEPNLFSVACVFAEMVDEGRIKVGVARQVLEGACPDLRKTLGHEGVRMTIANAFRHVEEKVLATPPSAANTGVN